MAGVTIVNVLPRLMGTYGDTGNELALAHRLRIRGMAAECLRVEPGESIPRMADIYVIGGGEDRAQPLAARLMAPAIRRAATDGAIVFAVCGGYQILGSSFTDSRGTTHEGLGLLDVVTLPLSARAVGEVIVKPDPRLAVDALVGFENHRGGTTLGPDAAPLGRVVSGVGNGDGRGTEGARQGNIFGTYLHGPALALNPTLADLLLSQVVGALAPVDDLTAERVRAGRLGLALPSAADA